MSIGKCPNCKEILTKKDIDDIEFRGIEQTHIAYVCKKCNTIIGFGTTRLIGIG